jgi:hypothetical protein
MAKNARKSSDASQRALTITAIVVVAAAALTAGAIFGIGVAWRRIAARPEFLVQPGNVTLDAAWVRVEEMKRDFLLTSPRDKKGRSILDAPVSIFEPKLAERVAAAYKASPWVRSVLSVRKEFPNRLEVKLDLRAPYAAIKRSGGNTYVSDDGVVLDPKVYVLTSDKTKELKPMVEIPSDSKPPTLGKVWNDPAVTGGLEMLRLCRGVLSKLPVALISIEMQNPTPAKPPVSMAWLSLGADPAKGPLVQWGRTPNCPVSDFEVPTQTKVNSLLAVVAREKQGLWRFKQIDVRDVQVRCEE